MPTLGCAVKIVQLKLMVQTTPETRPCHRSCTCTSSDDCISSLFRRSCAWSQHRQLPIPSRVAGPCSGFGKKKLPANSFSVPLKFDTDNKLSPPRPPASVLLEKQEIALVQEEKQKNQMRRRSLPPFQSHGPL